MDTVCLAVAPHESDGGYTKVYEVNVSNSNRNERIRRSKAESCQATSDLRLHYLIKSLKFCCTTRDSLTIGV